MTVITMTNTLEFPAAFKQIKARLKPYKPQMVTTQPSFPLAREYG